MTASARLLLPQSTILFVQPVKPFSLSLVKLCPTADASAANRNRHKKKARIKVNSWLVQEAKQSGAAMLGPPAHHALRGT